MTQRTPQSSSINGLISPVNAPLLASAHRLRAEPDARCRAALRATAASAVNGGADHGLDRLEVGVAAPAIRARTRVASRDRLVHLPVSGDQRPRSVHASSALERGDAGQRLAFEKLERRAAAGRDVRHRAGKAELVRGRGRVAAADDAGRAGARRLGDRFADDARAVLIRRLFVDAHRSVEDDRLRRAQARRHRRRRSPDRCRGSSARRRRSSATVRARRRRRRTRRRRPRRSAGAARRPALRGERDDRSWPARDRDRAATCRRRRRLRGQKRVGHPAADHERVDAREQVVEHADFIGDLRAADRADERLRRVHRSAWSSAASSASIKKPAYAGRSRATPSVEACARCAVPKASLT